MAESLRRFAVPTEAGLVNIYATDGADAERRVRRGEGALQADLAGAEDPGAARRETRGDTSPLSPLPLRRATGQRPGMGLTPGASDPVLQFQQSAPESDPFNITARGVVTGTGALGGAIAGSLAGGTIGGIGLAGVGSAGFGALYDAVMDPQGPSLDRAVEDASLGMAGEVLGLGAGAVAGATVRGVSRSVQAAPPTVNRARSLLSRAAGVEDPIVAAAKRELAEIERMAAAAREMAQSQAAAGRLDIQAAEGAIGPAETAAKATRTTVGEAGKREATALAQLEGAVTKAQAEAALQLSAQQTVALAKATADDLVNALAAVPPKGAAGPSLPIRRGTTGRAALGTTVAEAVDASIQSFKATNTAAFRAIDAAVGDAPVVTPAALRQTARDLTEQGRLTLGASSEARRLSGATGGTLDASQAIDPRSTALPIAQLSRLGQSAQEQILAQLMDGLERPMTWRQARALEAQLGEIAFRGGQPIGTVRQGEARALYRALRSDLDAFLKTPTAGGVSPALDAAKQTYRITRTLSTSALARALRTNPDAALDTVFGFGKGGEFSATKVLDFKQLVPDPVYQQTVTGLVARMFDRAKVPTASGGTVFSPKAFLKEAEPYLKAGRDGADAPLDLILDPAAARGFRRVVEEFRRYAGAEDRLLSATGAKAVADAQAEAKRLGLTFTYARARTQIAKGQAAEAERGLTAADASARAVRQGVERATLGAERAAETAATRIGPARAAFEAARAPILGLRPGQLDSLMNRVIRALPVVGGVAGGYAGQGATGALAGGLGLYGTAVAARRVLPSEPVVRVLTGQWSGRFGEHSARAAAHIIGQPGVRVLSRQLEENVQPALSLRRDVTEE